MIQAQPKITRIAITGESENFLDLWEKIQLNYTKKEVGALIIRENKLMQNTNFNFTNLIQKINFLKIKNNKPIIISSKLIQKLKSFDTKKSNISIDAISYNIASLKNNNIKPNPKDLISVHDFKEIKIAVRIGFNNFILSPLFKTTTHPKIKPLGIYRYKYLAQKIIECKINKVNKIKSKPRIIALGGIKYKDELKLIKNGIYEYAAIDNFWN